MSAGTAGAQSLAPRSPLAPANGDDVLAADESNPGIRAGGFDIRGAAGISFGYDSNVYATEGGPQAEPLSVGEALVRADNQSERRLVFASAFLRARRFSETHDQDTTEFGIATGIDSWLGSQNHLSGGVSAERNYESRTDIETPTSIPVSLYDAFNGQLAYAHIFNRFSLESEISAARDAYDDATQQFRDRSLYRGELRGAYQFRSGLAWVVTGYYNRDEYDDPSPITASANTTGALLGVRMTVREVIDLELGGGYFTRSFDNGAADLSGVALRGSLAWHPTQLTSVRADVQRSDEPTQVAGAFGKVRTDTLFEVNHQYSRNLHLYAGVRAVFDAFHIIERNDRLYLGEFGAHYFFGRHSVVRFTYDFGSRSNATPDADFVKHVAMLSFIGRL